MNDGEKKKTIEMRSRMRMRMRETSGGWRRGKPQSNERAEGMFSDLY
jgi:hypothetical protein